MTNRLEPNADDLLTPAQAARISGYKPASLAARAERGQLTVSRPFGSHRRYRRDEIEALRRPVSPAGER